MIVAEGVPSLGELFNFRTGLWGIPGFSYSVLSMLIAFVVVSAFMLTVFRSPATVPSRYQLVGESVIGFVRKDIAEQVIGHEGERFVPYLTTLFLLIFSFNIMEIIPGVSFPATSKIAVPLFLAVVTYLVFNYQGLRAQGVGHYFKNIAFPPGVPLVMYILLTPIEILSILVIRPITLTLRLTFNMLAGHLILSLVAVLCAGLWSASFKAALLPFTILIGTALTGFELFVAFLQAFIFTILTALYIGGAVTPEH
ncbi:MAG: F0F1 ATP synthase subunit A [Mycobacteriales bacterium]